MLNFNVYNEVSMAEQVSGFFPLGQIIAVWLQS